MREAPAQICFVSAPFGVHSLPEVGPLDFDRVYALAIAPAARSAGFEVVRADEESGLGGFIFKAILERLLLADVVIADLSLGNPNVLYELGIRHAARPSGTILIGAQDVPMPFDLAGFRVLTYAAQGDEAGLADLRKRVEERLFEYHLGKGPIDSPAFMLLPDLNSGWLPENASRRVAHVGRLRTAVERAVKLPFEEALPALRAVEANLHVVGPSDAEPWIDVLAAYRTLASWDDVVRAVATMPAALREQRRVIQQLAVALARRGEPGDVENAEQQLRRLINMGDDDAETHALLGTVLKLRHSETGESHALEGAIEAYRTAYDLDRTSLYSGVNLAELLTLSQAASAKAELAELVPNLRRRVSEEVASGRADFWDLTTGVELAVLDSDWAAAEHLAVLARARAPDDWMLDTAVRTVARIGSGGPELDQLQRVVQILSPEPRVNAQA